MKRRVWPRWPARWSPFISPGRSSAGRCACLSSGRSRSCWSMPRVVDLTTSPPLARAPLGSMKRDGDRAQRVLDRVAVVEPRPSASVILVRDGPGGSGLETFMVRRHARSPVAPSAYVFPGGTVRSDDLEAEYPPDAQPLADVLSERSDTPVVPSQAAALYVAAVRELF